jgi:hypothetical protein
MSNLEQKVMANVAMIYTARKMASKTALKLYVLALSLAGIVFLVSLPHIADNFAHVAGGGVGSIAAFVLTAVISTTLVVQAALILGAAALASLTFDFFKSNRPVMA